MPPATKNPLLIPIGTPRPVPAPALPNPPTHRVLVADPHPVVRLGVRALLAADPQFLVVDEAGEAGETLRKAVALRPDLLVLDLNLPGRDGLDLVEELGRQAPGVRLVVLTGLAENIFGARLLEAGVRAWMSKESGLPTLREGLRAVAAGRRHVSASLQQTLLQRHRRAGLAALSRRELNIFHLLGEGCALREMSARLGISPKTVGTHRERLKAKLGLRTSRELQELARHQGRNTPGPANPSLGTPKDR